MISLKPTRLSRLIKTSLILLSVISGLTSVHATEIASDTSTPVAQKITPNRLALNKDGVKVWTYQNPNNPAFNYRATTTVNASLQSVVGLILDTKHVDSWVPYTQKIDLLDNDDDKGTFTLHMLLDFPFPLSDRDVIVKGTVRKLTDGTVQIKSKSVEDARIPINPKKVRITQYEGSWKLKSITDNKTEVIAEGYADPAGHLPLTIVNMFVEIQPYKMLKNMQTAVLNYKQVNLPTVLK